jgi:hypothetical protein
MRTLVLFIALLNCVTEIDPGIITVILKTQNT